MLWINRNKLVAVGLAAVMLLVSEAAIAQTKQPKEITEEEIGIRKASLYDEDKVMPEHGEYPTTPPGESKKIKRAFENSPPLIPHDIRDMPPIDKSNNICMDCHMPGAAPGNGATAIPKSHLVNLVTGEYLKGKLDLLRYNCMQCHVQQDHLTPPVKNAFKSDFRDSQGKTRSNLIDILNEGVSLK
ncbi:MAG: nitrate reductase cytochrome c-type subunit [Dissulfurispiraceae bacterium]